uniref:Uncharacterized protein n=1 Tax=Chelydra serpentina TaxID=8475 RepID=A0A8C3SA32_CHESE
MILTLSSVLNKPKALSLPTHPHLLAGSVYRVDSRLPCVSGLFPLAMALESLLKHSLSPCLPLPWTLAILVETELHLVIDVLENFGDPSLSEQLVRPLEILRHIREDLKSCVSTGLQMSHATETPGCLEASVILNLFRLLNNDLKCAAYMEFCT